MPKNINCYYYHIGGHWENKNWNKWQQNSLGNISFINAVRKHQQILEWLLNFYGLLTSYYWFSLFIGIFPHSRIHFSLPNSPFQPIKCTTMKVMIITKLLWDNFEIFVSSSYFLLGVFHHFFVWLFDRFTQNYGMLGVLDRLHGTDVMFRNSRAYDRHIMLLGLIPLKQTFPDDTKKGVPVKRD